MRFWTEELRSTKLKEAAKKVEDGIEEGVIHEFCAQMQFSLDKIASKDFSAFMWILNLSKLPKNPTI